MKYWHVYKMSAIRIITYRLNFLLGRLQNLVWLLIFYFIWTSLSATIGSFAGFTQAELMTYVFMVHLLRPFIFGAQMTHLAEEINSGLFSSYLTKPITHFWFNYARELGEKSVLTVAALAEIAIAQLFVPVQFLPYLTGLPRFGLFLFVVIGAHFIYELLGYGVGLVAFWSNDAVGPRFLFNWIVEFTSGSFYPLQIIRGFFAHLIKWLPFGYIIYLPLLIFLHKISGVALITSLLGQLIWIFIAALLVGYVWKRGLRVYCGEGI